MATRTMPSSLADLEIMGHEGVLRGQRANCAPRPPRRKKTATLWWCSVVLCTAVSLLGPVVASAQESSEQVTTQASVVSFTTEEDADVVTMELPQVNHAIAYVVKCTPLLASKFRLRRSDDENAEWVKLDDSHDDNSTSFATSRRRLCFDDHAVKRQLMQAETSNTTTTNAITTSPTTDSTAWVVDYKPKPDVNTEDGTKDSFSYVVSLNRTAIGRRAVSSVIRTAEVTILPRNDAPYFVNAVTGQRLSSGTILYNAIDDVIFSNNEPDEAKRLALTGQLALERQLHAVDPDNHDLRYLLATPPKNGNVTLLDDPAGTFKYVPFPQYQGEDSFVLEANDEMGNFLRGGDYNAKPLSAFVRVVLQVGAALALPKVFEQEFTTAEDDPVILDLLRGITLIPQMREPGYLKFEVAKPPENGVFQLFCDGFEVTDRLTCGNSTAGGSALVAQGIYSPAAHFSGEDQVTVRILPWDAENNVPLSGNQLYEVGPEQSATIRFTVTPLNDAPTIVGAKIDAPMVEDAALSSQYGSGTAIVVDESGAESAAGGLVNVISFDVDAPESGLIANVQFSGRAFGEVYTASIENGIVRRFEKLNVDSPGGVNITLLKTQCDAFEFAIDAASGEGYCAPYAHAQRLLYVAPPLARGEPIAALRVVVSDGEVSSSVALYPISTKCALGYRVADRVEGQSNSTETCVPCPAGYFSSLRDARKCVACAPGSFSTGIQGECTLCAEGTYQDGSQSDQCKGCPYGSTSARGAQNRTMCFCKPGLYGVNGYACHECPNPSGVNTSVSSRFDDLSVTRWTWCAEGGLRWPLPMDGYYVSIPSDGAPPTHETIATVRECFPNSACRELAPPPDVQSTSARLKAFTAERMKEILSGNVCRSGYEGFACDTCTSDYYRISGRCEKCPGIWALILWLFVFTLIIALPLYAFRSAEHFNGIYGPLDLAVQLGQILSLFRKIDMAWPSGMLYFFEIASVLNLNLELLHLECYVGRENYNYLTRYRAAMLVPACLFAMLFVARLLVLAHLIFQRTVGVKLRAKYPSLIAVPDGQAKGFDLWYQRTRKRIGAFLIGPLINSKSLASERTKQDIAAQARIVAKAFLVFFHAAYAMITVAAFDYFDCRKDDVYGHYYLASDPSMRCSHSGEIASHNGKLGRFVPSSNSKYNDTMTAAIIGVLAYPVGVLVVSALFLYRIRKVLQSKAALDIGGFLYVHYEDRCFWWELVRYLKVILICFLAQILPSLPGWNPSAQARINGAREGLGGLFILFVSFVINGIYAPYVDDRLDMLSNFAFISHFFTLFSGVIFNSGTRTDFAPDGLQATVIIMMTLSGIYTAVDLYKSSFPNAIPELIKKAKRWYARYLDQKDKSERAMLQSGMVVGIQRDSMVKKFAWKAKLGAHALDVLTPTGCRAATELFGSSKMAEEANFTQADVKQIFKDLLAHYREPDDIASAIKRESMGGVRGRCDELFQPALSAEMLERISRADTMSKEDKTITETSKRETYLVLKTILYRLENKSRKLRVKLDGLKPKDATEEDRAAVMLQSAFRGRMARRRKAAGDADGESQPGTPGAMPGSCVPALLSTGDKNSPEQALFGDGVILQRALSFTGPNETNIGAPEEGPLVNLGTNSKIKFRFEKLATERLAAASPSQEKSSSDLASPSGIDASTPHETGAKRNSDEATSSSVKTLPQSESSAKPATPIGTGMASLKFIFNARRKASMGKAMSETKSIYMKYCVNRVSAGDEAKMYNWDAVVTNSPRKSEPLVDDEEEVHKPTSERDAGFVLMSAPFIKHEHGSTVRVIVKRRCGNFPAPACSVRLRTIEATAVEEKQFSAVDKVIEWPGGDDSERIIEIPILSGATGGDSYFLAALSHPSEFARLHNACVSTIFICNIEGEIDVMRSEKAFGDDVDDSTIDLFAKQLASDAIANVLAAEAAMQSPPVTPIPPITDDTASDIFPDGPDGTLDTLDTISEVVSSAPSVGASERPSSSIEVDPEINPSEVDGGAQSADHKAGAPDPAVEAEPEPDASEADGVAQPAGDKGDAPDPAEAVEIGAAAAIDEAEGEVALPTSASTNTLSDLYEVLAFGPVRHVAPRRGAIAYIRDARDRTSGALYDAKTTPRFAKGNQLHEWADSLNTEVRVLRHMSGGACIPQLENVLDDDEGNHMIQEPIAAVGRSLPEAMLAHATAIEWTETDAAVVARAMLAAIRDMHSRGVVHRALNLESFWVVAGTNTDSSVEPRLSHDRLRLLDTATMCFAHGDNTTSDEGVASARFSAWVADPAYAAPECLAGEYGRKADVWAVGVAIYLMLTGVDPFAGTTDAETFDAILTRKVCSSEPADHEKHLSDVAADFLRAMLTKSESERIEAEAALAHPWLDKASGDERKTLPQSVLSNIESKMEMISSERQATCTASAACILIGANEDARAKIVDVAVSGKDARVTANVVYEALASTVSAHADTIGEGASQTSALLEDANAELEFAESTGVPTPKVDATTLLYLLGDVTARAPPDDASSSDVAYSLCSITQAIGAEAAAACERASLA